jgi:parallel beta-helix repeat protein
MHVGFSYLSMSLLLLVSTTLFAEGIQLASFSEPEERNSVAINAAIRQCRRGEAVRLLASDYDLSEPVRMKSGIKLLGAGQDKTIFTYSGERSDPFIIVTGCDDVEIGHLTLDGRNRPLGQDGVRAENSRRLFIHHLTIRDLAKGNSPFVHAVMFTGRNPTMERGVTDSVVADCQIERIGIGAEFGGGIRMAWGSVRNRVERNVIRDTGRGGIFGDHSAELIIRNNRVSGSGGEGLGVEIWGGCPRSLIEDNVIDHWLSVDKGDQSAVRRNIIGAGDGSLKFIGIEIIARDVVVTDNVIERGNAIGLSVSNKEKKDNVFWGYNTIKDCAEWGAQFQGETGGIAHHYLYRCNFERTIHGDPRVRYPQAGGHGFRFNGASRELVFEECTFRDNGACGVQFGGENVDAMTFLRCVFKNNANGSLTGLSPDKTIEFNECSLENEATRQPTTKAFSGPPPVADFRMPDVIQAGVPVQFECVSKPGTGDIVERLWDFNHGIAEVSANPRHTFERPGKYRVTLVVWDRAGRGGRIEKTIEVTPGK